MGTATLITDASYCSQTKSAGYGFWIASDRSRFPGGGEIKQDVNDATVAELFAVVNGLWYAIKGGAVIDRDNVLIQTDCMAVITLIDGDRMPRRGQEENGYKQLLGIIDMHQLTIEMRHVKGHTMKRDARSITNKLCDSRAKRFMRERRKRVLAEVQINIIKEVLND